MLITNINRKFILLISLNLILCNKPWDNQEINDNSNVSKIIFASGDSYSGEHSDGIMNGMGLYIWNLGGRYEGEWKDGVFHGIGVYKFRNGDTYHGMFKKGKFSGYGIYNFTNGGYYKGEFNNNNVNGIGIYKNENDRFEIGNFNDGVHAIIKNKKYTPKSVNSFIKSKYGNHGIYDSDNYPAFLVIDDLILDEPSGNNILDGREKGSIKFSLSNKGKGFATKIEIALLPLKTDVGLIYNSKLTIDRLDSNSSILIDIPITADINVSSVEREFQIEAIEHFGFDANPVLISFNTAPFKFPDLRIEKLAVDDDDIGDSFGNGNSIIEPGESVEVTLFIQNFGDGDAKNVEIEVILGNMKNIYYPDAGQIYTLGDINSKDYTEMKFYFNTNRRFKEIDIPLSIKISDLYNRSGEVIDLGLKSGELTKNIVRVRTEGIEEESSSSEMKKITGLITQEELMDIERKIREKLEELNNISILNNRSEGESYTYSSNAESTGDIDSKISNNSEIYIEEDKKDEEWRKDKTSCHYRLNAEMVKEDNNDSIVSLYEECIDDFFEQPLQCNQYYGIAKAYKEANKDWESSFNILNDGYQRALGESECLGTLTDNLYIWDYLISAQRVGLDGPILDIFQAKISEESEKTLIEYILSKVIEPPMVKLYVYFIYAEIKKIEIDSFLDYYYESTKSDREGNKDEYCDHIRDIDYELQKAINIQNETSIESYKKNFNQLEKNIKRTERLFSCDN